MSRLVKGGIAYITGVYIDKVSLIYIIIVYVDAYIVRLECVQKSRYKVR